MTGRIAIVTGAGSGIGAALARALSRRGDTVVCVDRDGDAAAETAGRLPGASARRVDVTDAAAVAAAVASVVGEHGRLDVIVNNAGIGMGGPVEDLSLDYWDRIIDVNVRGVVHGVAAAYPVMVRQGSGHIVNTASLAGLVPAPFLTPYAMTKHAVVGLSLSLRAEAAPHGVRVTAVCPGPVETPILDGRPEPGLPPMPNAAFGRELLTRMGPLYTADALAADVLRGMDRDRALVVAPGRARVAWRLARISPGLLLRVARREVDWAARRLSDAERADPTAPR